MIYFLKFFSFYSGNVHEGSPFPPTAIPNNSSTQECRAVTEFRTRMLHGISMYPVIRQCTLLAAILENSGEKIPTIAGDLVNKPHQHLPCLRGISESASVVNTTALRLATDVHVSKTFNRLPLAYKCLVLSQVARAIHGKPTKSLQKTGRFLQETTATLTQHLPLLDTSGKCAGGKSRAITKAYVQLGIRLRKLMPFKVWLKRFKNKLPAVYLRHVSHSGKLSEIVNSWKREKNGDAVAIIPRDKFVVRVKDAPVQDGNNVVVTFSFLSRQSSGDYTTVDGDDVVAALDAMRRSQLNSLLQAEVIGSLALVGDKSERRHPSKGWQAVGGKHRAAARLFPEVPAKVLQVAAKLRAMLRPPADLELPRAGLVPRREVLPFHGLTSQEALLLQGREAGEGIPEVEAGPHRDRLGQRRRAVQDRAWWRGALPRAEHDGAGGKREDRA